MQQNITIEDVEQMKGPAQEFKCLPTPLLKFITYIIRDVDANFVLFRFDNDGNDLDQQEVMSLQFSADYFEIKSLGTTKIFKTGPQPLKNLLIIERFYFKNQLISSYEFKFPFCIPNSTNTWESIYDLPAFGQNLKEQMLLHPWETRSDTFLFIDGKLSLHERAEYDYTGDEEDID